jgi:hypothetical protein
LGLRFLIEFFSHSSNLPMFELGGSDQRSELSFRTALALDALE